MDEDRCVPCTCWVLSNGHRPTWRPLSASTVASSPLLSDWSAATLVRLNRRAQILIQISGATSAKSAGDAGQMRQPLSRSRASSTSSWHGCQVKLAHESNSRVGGSNYRCNFLRGRSLNFSADELQGPAAHLFSITATPPLRVMGRGECPNLSPTSRIQKKKK